MVRTVWSFNIQEEATRGKCFLPEVLAEVGYSGLRGGHTITYLSLRRLEFNFKAFANALAPATPMSFPRKLSGQARSLRCRDRLSGDCCPSRWVWACLDTPVTGVGSGFFLSTYGRKPVLFFYPGEGKPGLRWER